MKPSRAHLKLLLAVMAAGLCAWGVLRGPLEQDIQALVPKALKQALSLFQHSPLSQKLLVFVQAPSAVQAAQTAQWLGQQLTQEKLVQPRVRSDENVFSFLLRALPARFDARDQAALEKTLSPQGIDRQLAQAREQLFSLESMAVKQRLPLDPFNLTSLLIAKWARLGENTQTQYQGGFLANEEGTLLAGVYDTPAVLADVGVAQRIQQTFARLQKELPAGVRIFFMGGLRYTWENFSVIKRDLVLISLTGLTLLAVLFWWLFRSKRAVLIYLLPLLVLPPAALITQCVFGRLSGITLGFGSVVAGLSVDYAIYVYFALQASAGTPAHTLLRIRRHLGCNFLTSAACFAALLFSSIEVFKQIAVFGISALALALWAALYILPDYFACAASAPRRTAPWRIKPLAFLPACLLSLCLLAFGAWGVQKTVFSHGLDSLNSVSASFVQDKQLADQLFSANEQALLFALGSTADEALAQNEALSGLLPAPLAVSGLFVSANTRRENQARWNGFWSDKRVARTRRLLQETAQKNGFQAAAFAPFWQWLPRSLQGEDADFSAWYNPLVRLDDGSYAVVNIVPDEPAYEQAAAKAKAVFVSVRRLQNQLTQAVKKEAVWVVSLASVFNLLAVWGLFRRLKEALLCFIPVVLGGCVLFGVLALSGVQVNLFGLIFLPLLVGLGIDYAIFQLMKYRAGEEASAVYPVQALLAAGLSTLVGFGVLALAQHTVLFMMGLCALIGIGGAVAAAVWVLPAFLKRYV